MTTRDEPAIDIDAITARDVHTHVAIWSDRPTPWLKHKVLFGSDPVINPDRWMAAFNDLDIKPEVRPLVLKESLLRLH